MDVTEETAEETLEELRERFIEIRDRYAEVCEASTRLCDRIGDGLASQKEMDELQAGKFSDREQVYEDFMNKMDKKPYEIQAAVFGW
ncbi:hypothetical protein [Shimazuella soli]|uniref:hypothetical protein n=1 Tax=Shimazuella soli TaxID=1892854 RepID=UPI001F10FB01|nr:hypothetical protein [Shimazuella soli]